MTITHLPTPAKPKRRRRVRCEFCNELYHRNDDAPFRGVCSVCWPAFCEIERLEHFGLLLGGWQDYHHIIAPLARNNCDLVLDTAGSTAFYAIYRWLSPDDKTEALKQVHRIAVENRRGSMRLVSG